jgi:nucleotide-binding universal stress UspA family protein
MQATIRRKLLLAVDGSDQALEAVRYAGTIAPPGETGIVLFYVGSGFPDVFWDMNNNPLYRTKKSNVMGWLADSQLAIGEFKEKAFKILQDAGFPESAIAVKTQAKKTGVLNDIIQESYQDYNAVIAGRTGVSRLKDFFLGSIAMKLADKIMHIPTVIVSGRPRTGKVLIALDESIEAMRGVSSVAALAGLADVDISIYHCLCPPARFRLTGGRPSDFEDEKSWRAYNENRFRPCMEEAIQRLTDAGVKEERISRGFVFARGNIIQKIVETAVLGKFGTIVVGRREAATFAQEYIRGRFGETIIKSIDNMAVWIVS